MSRPSPCRLSRTNTALPAKDLYRAKACTPPGDIPKGQPTGSLLYSPTSDLQLTASNMQGIPGSYSGPGIPGPFNYVVTLFGKTGTWTMNIFLPLSSGCCFPSRACTALHNDRAWKPAPTAKAGAGGDYPLLGVIKKSPFYKG